MNCPTYTRAFTTVDATAPIFVQRSWGMAPVGPLASQVAFRNCLLGYPDVRNYDGSWTEWRNLVRTPIEKA